MKLKSLHTPPRTQLQKILDQHTFASKRERTIFLRQLVQATDFKSKIAWKAWDELIESDIVYPSHTGDPKHVDDILIGTLLWTGSSSDWYLRGVHSERIDYVHKLANRIRATSQLASQIYMELDR